MKKIHFLSLISLLTLIITIFNIQAQNSYEIHFCALANPDFYINGKFQGIEYAIVPVNSEITVVAELLLQTQKWTLVSHDYCTLISEKYMPGQPYSVIAQATQEWKLKSTIPGDYLLVFERIVNNEVQQKIISIHVQ